MQDIWWGPSHTKFLQQCSWLLVSGDAQQATVRPSLELASFAEAGQLAACMSVNNSILQKICCKFVL
jgi:hypothetical protein